MVGTVDLTGALARGGPQAGCEEVLRRWFGWDGPTPADPAELLAALQGPELQERVGWHQDRVLAIPEQLPDSRQEIASENQWCWQAGLAPDGRVEIGEHVRVGWVVWHRMDLADLLLRLLVREAMVAGPCIWSSEVPPERVDPFTLLPSLTFVDDDGRAVAGLTGVIGGDGWFGTSFGQGAERSVHAGPVDPAMAALVRPDPGVRWRRDPGAGAVRGRR